MKYPEQANLWGQKVDLSGYLAMREMKWGVIAKSYRYIFEE